MAYVSKQNSMPKLSAVQQQTSKTTGGWFDWIKWNRYIDNSKNHGDTANVSITEKQTFQDMSSLTNIDKVSNEWVEMYPGLYKCDILLLYIDTKEKNNKRYIM